MHANFTLLQNDGKNAEALTMIWNHPTICMPQKRRSTNENGTKQTNEQMKKILLMPLTISWNGFYPFRYKSAWWMKELNPSTIFKTIDANMEFYLFFFFSSGEYFVRLLFILLIWEISISFFSSMRCTYPTSMNGWTKGGKVYVKFS